MTMRSSLAIILEIIRKEFYQIRQDKRMLLVSILAPLLQVLLLGYAATTDIRNSTMITCDQDQTAESRNLIARFTTSGYFVIGEQTENPAEVDRRIQGARANIGLVIPQGFSRKLFQGESAPLQVVLDGTDANSASILLNYTNQIVLQYAQTFLADAPAPSLTVSMPRIQPEPRVWFNPDLLSAYFMVPGVVALVLMIITMTLTSLGIVREREIGTLEQLLVTPIKPYQLLLGKLIPFIIIGFLDVTLVLALARFWFGVPMRGSLVLLFGLSGLFIMTTLGLGLLISTIAKSQQQAMLIAQFFFFMPFMFLSGFAFPITNMPVIIQYMTYLIPLRYFLEIVRGIFLKGAGIHELWTQAVALLIIGITILTLSILRFRRKLE